MPNSTNAEELQTVPDSMDTEGIQVAVNPVYGEGVPEPVYEEPMHAGLLSVLASRTSV